MYKVPSVHKLKIKYWLRKCTINPITKLKEKFLSFVLIRTLYKIINNILIPYSKHDDMFAIRIFLIISIKQANGMVLKYNFIGTISREQL